MQAQGEMEWQVASSCGKLNINNPAMLCVFDSMDAKLDNAQNIFLTRKKLYS